MKEGLRRIFHRVAAFFLRVRSRDGPLITGGRCVVIAPHQDDEAFGCAGLILNRRDADIPVSVIYLTDGAGSHPDHPRLNPNDIAQLRRMEAIQAMGELKLTESSLHFLGASDGMLTRLSPLAFEKLATQLADLFTQMQVTELFLPCRDDSSAEHTGAFHLTQRGLQLACLGPRIYQYPIWARWRPQRLLQLGLTSHKVWRLSFPHDAARKRTAMAAYVSQTKPTQPWPDPVLPQGFVDCFASSEEFFFEC